MTAMRSIFRISLADIFALFCCFVLLIPHLGSFANDPGLTGHLASGLRMIEEGRILFQDPFLATVTPLPWIYDQWLSAIGIAYFYEYGSWELLYAFGVVCYLATFFLFLFPLSMKFSGSLLASIVAVFLSLKLATMHFVLRPILLSFLLFAVVLFIVYSSYQQQKQESCCSPKPFILLPFVFLLWANVHPYFVLGLLLYLSFIVAALCDMVIRGHRKIGRYFFVTHLPLFILCLFATCINPYSINIYKNILSLGSSDFFLSFLGEWKPIDFKSEEGKFFELYLFLLFSGYVFTAKVKKSWSFFELFIIGGFLKLALESARGIPLFVIVTTPFLAQSLTSLASVQWFQRFPAVIRFGYGLKKYEEWEYRRSMGIIGFFLSAFVVGFFVLRYQHVPFYAGEYGPEKTKYPYQAVSFLNEKAQQAGRIVVLNNLNWGGFLAWKSSERVKYIYDDRLSLFEEDHFRRYLHFVRLKGELSLPPNIKPFDYILYEKNTPLERHIRIGAEYEVVYEDSVAVIFRRDSSAELE